MASNIPEITYVTCFTADDGVYSCGHLHPSIREAMNCLVPNGGSFIRAHDAGVFRSLTNQEFIDFLESLQEMPWSRRARAQEPTTEARRHGEQPENIRRANGAQESTA